jgi:hypothetical protein
VRERGRGQSGWGQAGEMTQASYAHMNNKIIIKKKQKEKGWWNGSRCRP